PCRAGHPGDPGGRARPGPARAPGEAAAVAGALCAQCRILGACLRLPLVCSPGFHAAVPPLRSFREPASAVPVGLSAGTARLHVQPRARKPDPVQVGRPVSLLLVTTGRSAPRPVFYSAVLDVLEGLCLRPISRSFPFFRASELSISPGWNPVWRNGGSLPRRSSFCGTTLATVSISSSMEPS